MSTNPRGKFWSFSFYLLFFAGAVAYWNYLALFFKERGLSGSQIGVLMGVASLVALFAGPLWSGLADARQRHRLVLSTAMLGGMTAVFLFPYFHTFGWFLVLVVMQALFGGPVISLADNATMAMLGEERHMYGRVRLGGTLGWGLAAPIVGAVVERYGLRFNFSIYTAFMLLALAAAQQLHFGRGPTERSFLAGVRELLADRKWILFLAIVFIAGIGNAAITSYLFLYLQEIGTSPVWMGWALTISTAAEFPALFFADRLMKRLGSRGLLALGLAATGLRCMLYGIVAVPWIALAVQLLQVATFPILLVAGVSYANENAPPGLGATAQSIFGSAFVGFGYAAGGFLGGVLLDYVGVQGMYFTFGVGILLAAVIFSLLRRGEAARQPAIS